ncbi:MAG: hypothetical protein LBL72_00475 [Candidatus Accumulibacter sp.]|nr:hypothetical protein [Accumulibacter sp.]
MIDETIVTEDERLSNLWKINLEIAIHAESMKIPTESKWNPFVRPPLFAAGGAFVKVFV